MKTSFKLIALSVGLLAIAPASQASTIFAQWDTISGNNVYGTINGIGIHYAGEVATPTQVGNTGIQYWTEPNSANLPYTPVTGNLPARTDIITLSQGPATHTITFDQAVLNPMLLINSLGQDGDSVTYTFDQTATVVSSGWSYWNPNGSGTLTQSGASSVVGTEGSGVVQFSGLISEITWTTDNYEYWHGITVGLTAVPEPSTILAGALLLLPFGVSSLRLLRRES